MRRALIGLISLYKVLVSPWLGQNCRFYPSCSCYAQQAIATHGATKGCWLAIKRIFRCHPWHTGGYDPVPLKTTASPIHSHSGNCSHG